MTTTSAPLGIDIDLTTDYLEEHWGDDAKCESPHLGNGAPACSEIAVAVRIMSCCEARALVCSAIVATFARGHRRCRRCQRAVELCWSVIPV